MPTDSDVKNIEAAAEKPANKRKLSLFMRALIVLSIALFSALIVLSAVRTYFHWTREYRFGEIVGIEDDRITIREREGRDVTVLTDDRTLIRKGREMTPGKLVIGDHVMVVGPILAGGEIQAHTIRIVIDDIPPPGQFDKGQPPIAN